jgi:serine protease Do
MRISNLTPRGWRGALLAGLLGTTALAGYAAGQGVFAADAPQPAQSQAAQSQPAPIQPAAPAAQTLPDFASLVARARPAVVSVTTKLGAEPASDEEGIPSPFGQMMPMQPQHRQMVEARGSGFIIDPDGIIVTNNHVVDHAKSVSVTLDDGTELPAKVVGRDPRTDIAVLRVSGGHKLPYVQLGNSDDVKVGEWVVAMGNPFGLGGTVTAGIVSARGRDIGSGPYDSFLQIDAPINRGNSGGPLFTQDGRVVGINTAILSPSGGSIGIGFAIPANTVKTVVAELEQHGHVTRGYLGVEAQPVTAEIASALNLPKRNPAEAGALVAEVQPDSPAAKAGLKAGDVITAVNGKSVGNPRDLAVDVAAVKPGEQAKLDVLQDGQPKSLEAAVTAMPNQETADAGQGNAEAHPTVGLGLAPLSPDMRAQLNLPEHLKGAVVAQVAPGSPADQAGLQQGDVILGVGDRSVSSAEQAAHAIRDAARRGHSLALRVFRDGHTQFVGIDLNKDSNAG